MNNYYIFNRYAPVNKASVKCSVCKLSHFIDKETFEKKEEINCVHCNSKLTFFSKDNSVN